MLTQKQKDLLLHIHDSMQNKGVAPSFDEMKDALGLKSKSGIHRLISGLVERGYLRRLPNRARALEVVRLPDDYTSSQQKGPTQDNTTVFKSRNDGVKHIPLYGKIAAGTPIEAIAHEGDYIDAPLSMLGAGEYYGLYVDGDSMMDVGIHDGDLAVIKRAETANSGDIVVALVDEQEVTLKTLEKKGPTVNLIPHNQNHKVQTYEADRVRIQGVLSSIIRQY